MATSAVGQLCKLGDDRKGLECCLFVDFWRQTHTDGHQVAHEVVSLS